MKKSILFIFALMAAMSLSCKKEALTDGSGSENSGNTTGEYAYTIKGTFASEDDAAAGDSKVGIGKEGENNYFGTWEEGDQVVIYEVVQAQTSRERITDKPIVVSNISEDGKSADIRFNIRENVSLQPPTPSGQTTPPDKVPLNENTKCRAFCYSEEVFPKGLVYGQGCLAAEQVQKGTGLTNTSLKKYAFIYTTNDASVANKVLNPADNCAFYHALSYVDISFSSTDFAEWKVEKIVMYNESGTHMAATQYNVNCSITPWPHTVAGTKYASAITALYGDKSSKITLSFSNDVTLSSETQDACLVSLPTHLLSETDASGNPSQDPQVHTVVFQLSKDGAVEYAKVRFNTCLKGGCVKKLKVGAITKTDITNDYKDIYDAGFDIKIGDMVVNKTTFPTASVIAPAALDGNTAKGLVFIDDKEGLTVNLAQQRTFGTGGEIVVIGRYANIGKQTNIGANSLRIAKNTAFLNLKFTCIGGEAVFERNSGQTTRDALRLVDCYIDANTTSPSKNVIKDRGNNPKTGAIAAPFSKILVDNCVVKLGINSNTPRPFYYLNKPLAEEEPTTTRTLEIKNSTIFYPTATVDGRVIDVYEVADEKDKSGNIKTPGTHTPDEKLDITLTSNTFVNFVSGGMNRVYRVKDLVSDKDLVYASDMTSAPKWNSPKYHWGLGYSGNKVGTCSNCYLAWDNLWSDATNWQAYAETSSEIINKKNAGTPFTAAANYNLGYFPVDRTKVTNGAGASYDTKGYCTWTTE